MSSTYWPHWVLDHFWPATHLICAFAFVIMSSLFFLFYCSLQTVAWCHTFTGSYLPMQHCPCSTLCLKLSYWNAKDTLLPFLSLIQERGCQSSSPFHLCSCLASALTTVHMSSRRAGFKTERGPPGTGARCHGSLKAAEIGFRCTPIQSPPLPSMRS